MDESIYSIITFIEGKFFMNRLTNGQVKIRQIITANLEKYFSIEKDSYDKRLILYRELQQIFKLEPEIINDSVTGRSCGYRDISSDYEAHLFWTGQRREVSSNFPKIQFHSFLYTRTFNDRFNSPKFYLGGEKYDTTFRALFTLAQGQTVPLDIDAGIAYYLKSGILTCGGSTHRILAHILWGEPRIKAHSMTLVDESGLDEDLNQALLKLEINHIDDYLSSRNSQGYSSDEILCIKKLAHSTDIEQKIVADYCSHRTGYKLSIKKIEESLSELRRVQKRNRLQVNFSRFRQNTKSYSGSDFEYWFDQYYSKKQDRLG